ncbi:conodipine-P3-like [Babylonia areolata]|uniref:conodipine-P3-like n=1 Tax=Babylonia areolata TaxID=304850 RepID=UPI003FD31052
MCDTRMPAVVAVVVVMVVVAVQATDQCAKYANGCSVPFGLPFAYKDEFTPDCNRHDVCYGCGSAHGLTRDDCDTAFLNDMRQTCTTVRRRRGTRDKRNICSNFAEDLYYEAVRIFADSHFHHKDNIESYCGEDWVPSCLPSS